MILQGHTGIAHGGFNAQATGPADTDTAYPAKGHISAKSEFTGPVVNGVSQIHGDVVCIQNRGGETWEIRFLITSSTFDGVPVLDGTAAVDTYGSVFVKDNGKDADRVDENFSPATEDQESEDCGRALSFDLEDTMGGNVTIRG